jgi:hypothetical protein
MSFEGALGATVSVSWPPSSPIPWHSFCGPFGTASLDADAVLFVLPFPLIVWGADEFRRYLIRRQVREGRL